MGKKSGTEPFKVGPVELEGTAGAGLIPFWQELASTEVEGIGTVKIANSAMGGLNLFVLIPSPKGVPGTEQPPTTFAISLMPLAQAMVGAAVERFKTGEPAVWLDD